MSLTSFYDPYDGTVVPASLYYYKAGTEDPLTVYSDSSLQRIWAQPVLTGGSGRVPPVWVDLIDLDASKNKYRVRSFDQYGVLLEDVDNLPGGLVDPIDAPDVPDTPGTLPPVPSPLNAAIFHTGDIMMAWNIALPGKEGWLRCNGGTIGLNSGSEGSGGAAGVGGAPGTGVHDLYIHLWNNDPDFLLHTAGGTAEAAWLGGAEITLPDFRSRVPIGMDPMGDGSQTFPFRMEGAKVSATKGGVLGHLGANGGAVTITLILDNLPAYTPEVVDPGHTHILTDPTHAHSIWDGQHAHNRTTWTMTVDNNDNTGGANPVGADANGKTGPTMTVDYSLTGIGIYGISTGIHLDNYNQTLRYTGITIKAQGGKSTPFSMVPPFLSVAFYIHL
jgi:hypothetical protein